MFSNGENKEQKSYQLHFKLDKKVCEQTLSWLAKAGPESFKKFGKF